MISFTLACRLMANFGDALGSSRHMCPPPGRSKTSFRLPIFFQTFVPNISLVTRTTRRMASVIAKWSQLQTCRICLLPFELLSIIASTISSPPTGAKYNDITTKLLTLELRYLPVGVYEIDSPSTTFDG